MLVTDISSNIFHQNMLLTYSATVSCTQTDDDLFLTGKLHSAVFDMYIQYIPVLVFTNSRFLFLII